MSRKIIDYNTLRLFRLIKKMLEKDNRNRGAANRCPETVDEKVTSGTTPQTNLDLAGLAVPRNDNTPGDSYISCPSNKNSFLIKRVVSNLVPCVALSTVSYAIDSLFFANQGLGLVKEVAGKFMELASANPLAQGFGAAAFVLGVTAFLSPKDSKFRYLLASQNIALVPHFLLLGGKTGAIVAGITCMRNLLAANPRFFFRNLPPAQDKEDVIAQSAMKKCAPYFMGFYAVLGLSRLSNWFDVLPIAAACIGTYANFHLSGIKLRLGMKCGTLLWLGYGIHMKAIGPVCMELINLTANVKTIFKMWRSKNDK